jgi:tape measure domain-containing protein
MATERVGIEYTTKGARKVTRDQQAIGTTASGAGKKVGLLQKALMGMGLSAKFAAGAISLLTRVLLPLLAVQLGIDAVRAAGRAADAFTNLQNRVRLVTDSVGEMNAVTIRLRQIAAETQSSLQGTALLYSRVAQMADDLGLSQTGLLNLTKQLNQAILISGASTEEAANALRQLSQALGSGILRGEEYNAIIEASPFLIKVLADDMGVGIGAMREMAAAGKLTADIIVGAFDRAGVKLDELAKTQTPTLERSMQKMRDSTSTLVGALDNLVGFTRMLARFIGWVADKVGKLADAVVRLKGGTEDLTDKGGPEGPEKVDKKAAERAARREKAIKDAQRQLTRAGEATARGFSAFGAGGSSAMEARHMIEDLEREHGKLSETLKEEIRVQHQVNAEQEVQSAVISELLVDHEALAIRLDTINALYNTGAIDAKKFAEESRKIALLKKPLSEIEQLARDTFMNLGSLITDVLAGGENAFKNFAETAMKELARIATFEALFSLFPGLETSRIFGRQHGGPGGGRAIVGEGPGPEIVSLPAGSRVDPIPNMPAPQITIVNVKDEDELGRYIASGKADGVMINRLSQNQEAVGQIIEEGAL